MDFTPSTRCGLVLTSLVALTGCSSNSDNANAGNGGAGTNGGATASGGIAATGGATASGGIAAMGGTTASGGATTNGGASANGGNPASGGSGGATTAGGSSSGAAPASASQADIASFLNDAGYKSPPWISDVSTPRKGIVGSQHGDGVRVWENPTLVASIKAGRDGWMDRPLPDVGSMAVKEMYDDSGTLVGLAAAIRTDMTTGFSTWTYYCYAPSGRCGGSSNPTKDAPYYGNGGSNATIACAICHNSTIFTVPP